MKKLYAPWRHDYVTKGDSKKKNMKNDCVFCDKFSAEVDNDKENLVLKRFSNSALVMNKYPYNGGHLMVLPLDHQPTLPSLTTTVRAEIMEIVTYGTQLLEAVTRCQGINVGINIGKASGGGIPSHLHVHLIPRWHGDTNFLATVADTTLICSEFYTVYDELKEWINQNPALM